MLKEQKGITLVALVITIIVLLILAAVTLSMVLGDNGIVTKAKDAKDSTNKADIESAYKTAALELQTEYYDYLSRPEKYTNAVEFTAANIVSKVTEYSVTPDSTTGAVTSKPVTKGGNATGYTLTIVINETTGHVPNATITVAEAE